MRRPHLKRESRILIPYCSGRACVALVFRAPGSLDDFYVSLRGVEGLVENILASTTFHEIRFVLDTGPWSSRISETTGLPLLPHTGLPRSLAEKLLSLRVFAHQAALRLEELAGRFSGGTEAN